MPNLRKAARGKRRWVGVKVDTSAVEVEEFFEHVSASVGKLKIAWTSEDGQYLILEIRLEDYNIAKEAIRVMDYANSITSSGKIRLVKSRISSLN